MGRIAPITDIKLPKKRVLDALTRVFPACKQGLDIQTDKGERIRTFRQRSQNVWGINCEDYSGSWDAQTVTPYCKCLDPRDISYGEDTFDCIVWNNVMPDYSVKDLNKILSHLKRICSNRIYLTLAHTKKKSLNFWLKIFKSHGLFIDCIHKDNSGQFIVEAAVEYGIK